MNIPDELPEKPQAGIRYEPNKWIEIKKKLYELNRIHIRNYTLWELAKIYRVSVPTFKRMLAPWSKRLGPRIGRYYSIKQVKLIFENIELPSSYSLKDISEIYGVCIPTLKVWLEDFDHELFKTGHYFSLRQLYIIVSNLDIPSTLEEKEDDDLTLLLRLIK